MTLLQGFCQDWADRYDQLNNTTAADTFRSTLMVTALSYAFSSDLRNEFRNLNFPVDDQIYNELYNSVTTSKSDFSGYPSAFVLNQNYPNPFKAATTITWKLKSDAHVILKVYDFTGREIKTLVDCEQAKGEHKTVFNATRLPAGVYFYQLSTNGMFCTYNKMIICE
jgi:hypothetical protein